MKGNSWFAVLAQTAILCGGCNSNTPEPASVDMGWVGLRLTLVRTATDPFLPRFNLTLNVKGGRCASSTELFPDTGYAGRRNVYQAAKGMVYVVGQYDARIVNAQSCETSLSEFRHLDRDVVFIGSFDQDELKHWTYFPAAQRSERAFEKR